MQTSSSLPSERASSPSSPGCQQSAADSPPALLIPALIMPRLWQPPAQQASALCAFCAGPAASSLPADRIHHSPLGESLPRARPVSPGLQEVLRGRDLGRGIYAWIMPLSHTCIFSCAASMEWGKHLLPLPSPTLHRSLSLSLPLLCIAVHCSPQHTDIKSEIQWAKRLGGTNTQSSDFLGSHGGIPETICPGFFFLGIFPNAMFQPDRERARGGSGHMRTLLTVRGEHGSATQLVPNTGRERCKSWRPQRRNSPWHAELFSLYDNTD